MSPGLWVTQSAANRSYAASWWPVASPKCEVSLRHVRLSHKDWTRISLDRAVVPLAGVERLWRGRLSESTHSNPDVQNCLDGVDRRMRGAHLLAGSVPPTAKTEFSTRDIAALYFRTIAKRQDALSRCRKSGHRCMPTDVDSQHGAPHASPDIVSPLKIRVGITKAVADKLVATILPHPVSDWNRSFDERVVT
jgi:hypothetical protein